MAVVQAGLPDWRDAAAYAPLLNVERPAFAWEWLRRNTEFRTAANEAIARRRSSGPRREEAAAGHWGLHAFEDPALGPPAARPVWRAELHGLVLSADGEAWASDADAFVLEPLLTIATIIVGAGVQHLLLSDGCRSIRLDVAGVDLLSGPVRLHYRLSGMEKVDGPLLALRRLQALVRGRAFSRALHLPEARAARMVAMLRAHDAVQAGASQREIAAVLLSREAEEERWRIRAPSVRSQVQRLVRGAATMAGRGYPALLFRSGASRRA